MQYNTKQYSTMYVYIYIHVAGTFRYDMNLSLPLWVQMVHIGPSYIERLPLPSLAGKGRKGRRSASRKWAKSWMSHVKKGQKFEGISYGSVSKPCTPSVNIKIAGIYGCSSHKKWYFHRY